MTRDVGEHQGEMHDMFCSGPNRAHLTKVRVHRRSLLCAWPKEEAHKESFEVFLEDPEGNILVKVLARRKSLKYCCVSHAFMTFIHFKNGPEDSEDFHVWAMRKQQPGLACWRSTTPSPVSGTFLWSQRKPLLRPSNWWSGWSGPTYTGSSISLFTPLKELTMLWRMFWCHISKPASPQGSIWTWLEDQNPHILRYPRRNFASPKSSAIAFTEPRTMQLGSCLRLISMNTFTWTPMFSLMGRCHKTFWGQVGMPLWSLKGKKRQKFIASVFCVFALLRLLLGTWRFHPHGGSHNCSRGRGTVTNLPCPSLSWMRTRRDKPWLCNVE